MGWDKYHTPGKPSSTGGSLFSKPQPSGLDAVVKKIPGVLPWLLIQTLLRGKPFADEQHGLSPASKTHHDSMVDQPSSWWPPFLQLRWRQWRSNIKGVNYNWLAWTPWRRDFAGNSFTQLLREKWAGWWFLYRYVRVGCLKRLVSVLFWKIVVYPRGWSYP